ncbi:MAG: hypothetical protein MUF34_05125 [Polyangiaceae bacterium]|jgi:hypothetical protein|nr:hypothetical protein [Polyangiaceae bacterium]
MGQLEQFAKQLFEQETAVLTKGAVAWQAPPELGLAEVRLDGLLLVCAPERLAALSSPWSFAAASDEIVIELKMPGDHLDPVMVERALLRRQARQVQRMEDETVLWRGQEPLWIVAPHLPGWLRKQRKVCRVASGCYQIDPSPFSLLWVAANELPLVDELVPFLVARSGRSLDAFARWVAVRRPPAWVLNMLRFLPMSTALSEELMRALTPHDDPEVRGRQRRMLQSLLKIYPEAGQDLVEQGREEGREKGLRLLQHQLERRLGRTLTEAERAVMVHRFDNGGADRLGDVVLDLSAEALAAWLNEPNAT